MRYRTRLVLAFLALALVTSALLFFGIVRVSQRALTEQIRSTVLSIAVDAAALVDGDLHETIKSAADMGSPAYAEIEAGLRAVRDRHRRDDIHVAFIYTMRKISSDPDVWAYAVDAEEPGEDKSETGEVMVWEEQYSETDEPLILGAAYAEEKFTVDEYGHWLSANAPIRNSLGEPVAMLGVDVDAERVIAEHRTLVNSSLGALAIAIASGALLSLLLARWATRPLHEIASVVGRLGNGHLEARADLSSKDEFGELAATVNVMAEALQERDTLTGSFARVISPNVAHRLASEDGLAALLGRRCEVSVLACRIAGLKIPDEEGDCEELLERLNAFFESAVETCFKNDGAIAQLGGDRFLAVFGAPVEDASHERRAVDTALQIVKASQVILAPEGGLSARGPQVHIGIHSGMAMTGNIGANGKVEFRVLGEAPENAMEISRQVSRHQTRCLISETTVRAVRDSFPFLEVGDIEAASYGGLLRLFTLAEFRDRR